MPSMQSNLLIEFLQVLGAMQTTSLVRESVKWKLSVVGPYPAVSNSTKRKTDDWKHRKIRTASVR